MAAPIGGFGGQWRLIIHQAENRGRRAIHNMPMLDAVARGNAIRFVMARGLLRGGRLVAISGLTAFSVQSEMNVARAEY